MPIRITPAVKALLIAFVAFFVVQKGADLYFGVGLLEFLGLVPRSVVIKGAFWQLVTYSFLHSDVMHLLFNGLVLAFVGPELEAMWGARRFLRLYFVSVLAAGVAYLLLQLVFWKTSFPLVGASGGIYGLLVAYGIFFGERVMLFMFLFPMRVRHMVWLLAGIELLSGLFSPERGGMASVAHLAGMLGGLLYLYGAAVFKARARKLGSRGVGSSRADSSKRGSMKSSMKKSSHLKLVVNRDQSKAESQGKGQSSDSDSSDPKTWH